MKMLLCLLLAICLCSGFAASNQANEIQSTVTSELEGISEADLVTNSDCGCTKEPVPQCGCCAEFSFNQTDHKVCMNMTYVEKEKGIRFTVTFDGKVLLNETLSARNPPPLCQGVCPLSCICVKYYNMTYGDDHKWGGCLEIYGDVIIQILDIKFGCFYLPVKQEQKNTALNKPIHSLLNYMGFSDDIFNDIQQWFQKNFGSKMNQRRHKKKNPLNFLYKNRVEDNNGNHEVPPH